MYDVYLVTGATGHLGNTVLRALHARGAKLRALVLPNDPLAQHIPPDVEIVRGSVDDLASLEPLFLPEAANVCVIHCAGVISIASRADARLWRVNVEGTQNVVALCAAHRVAKLVYVSSVHAIPEKPKGERIEECASFPTQALVGDYARSKAEATNCVLQAARQGLNASVVHPSGIIGPYDRGNGSVTGTIVSYCNGKLRVGVRGGYDFVDVRDVAQGILACCDTGRPGQCYILSNRYASVREILRTLKSITHGRRILFCVPLGLVKLFAPLCERISLRRRAPLFLTPYSVYTMGSNSLFSHEKASRELQYRPRDMRETLADTVRWLVREGRVRARPLRAKRFKLGANCRLRRYASDPVKRASP